MFQCLAMILFWTLPSRDALGMAKPWATRDIEVIEGRPGEMPSEERRPPGNAVWPTKNRSMVGRILDYVDFGARTGLNGAFAWYADYPAAVQRSLDPLPPRHRDFAKWILRWLIVHQKSHHFTVHFFIERRDILLHLYRTPFFDIFTNLSITSSDVLASSNSHYAQFTFCIYMYMCVNVTYVNISKLYVRILEIIRLG